MTLRQLDDLKPAEIKEAAAAVMEDQEGGVHPARMLSAVAKKLDSDIHLGVPAGRQGTHDYDRFAGRVSRAMQALADEGKLVKVGPDDPSPDGRAVIGRAISYYTPKAYAAARETGDRVRAERTENSRRWADVRIRLAKENFHMDGQHGLSLDDWELLLRRAGL